MTYPKPELAKESPQRLHAKAPYRAPKLETLGSLRSATRGTGGTGSDGGGNMTMMSDRRTKEEILEIGRHPLGLGIYRFRYKAPYAGWYGAGRRVGVMADEVAEKYPDAVCRHADGYLRVDYGRLLRSELPSVASACDNPTQFLHRVTHDVPQA